MLAEQIASAGRLAKQSGTQAALLWRRSNEIRGSRL
jgi:hypothetical protein